MFTRLIGLETEYVLRLRPSTPDGDRLSNAKLFKRLVDRLSSRVRMSPAIVMERGWFLANGGNVKFERLPFLWGIAASGFVEGATPECRSPRGFLLYQRAQDVALSREAAASGRTDGDAALLKSGHDGHGNFLGSHENYEANIASGQRFRLWLWGLRGLLPCFFIYAVLAMLVLLVAIVLLLPLRYSPRLFSPCLRCLVFLFSVPIQIVGTLFVHCTGFYELRRHLLAFLISRTIITGAGTVGRDGGFSLSGRAATIRSTCGISAEAWRSIFSFGHIIKAGCDPLLGDPGGFAGL